MSTTSRTQKLVVDEPLLLFDTNLPDEKEWILNATLAKKHVTYVPHPWPRFLTVQSVNTPLLIEEDHQVSDTSVFLQVQWHRLHLAGPHLHPHQGQHFACEAWQWRGSGLDPTEGHRESIISNGDGQ